MSQIIVLPNEMFDDGSFECFNFWIADQDGTYRVGANNELIQHVKSQIEARMSQNKSWLDVRGQGLVYGCMLILEIQWG